MLLKTCVSFKQLRKEELKVPEIKNLSASLKLFPTPFKGIYYVPSVDERNGWFIDKPLSVLARAVELYLNSKKFYLSCVTAEEFWGIKWNPSDEIHIVNEKIHKKINLKERIERNLKKGTYRAKKIAKLLEFYGDLIILHKTKSIKNAKIKITPYGMFAMKSQIKKDKKRFREK